MVEWSASRMEWSGRVGRTDVLRVQCTTQRIRPQHSSQSSVEAHRGWMNKGLSTLFLGIPDIPLSIPGKIRGSHMKDQHNSRSSKLDPIYSDAVRLPRRVYCTNCAGVQGYFSQISV